MDLRHKFRHRKHRKGSTAELAAQLAPLEEQDRQAARKQSVALPGNGAHQEIGAIVVDNNDLHVSPEGGARSQRTVLGLEPVVIVILLVMLAFIIFVTWQITLLPTD